jgi:hypothetical protein
VGEKLCVYFYAFNNSNFSTTRKKTGKKILNWIDKISHSNLFKEFAEWKPVQNLMTEISSTRLILNVEVTVLEGLMTINLPPPPSDRLWYLLIF